MASCHSCLLVGILPSPSTGSIGPDHLRIAPFGHCTIRHPTEDEDRPKRPGDRVLSEEGFEQAVFTPTGVEPLALDAHLIDDRVHIEYVPTQVVTEFIRAKVIWGESKVDGIRYVSSVNEGHSLYVFFADQLNVVGTPASGLVEDSWLRLVDTRHRWTVMHPL